MSPGAEQRCRAREGSKPTVAVHVASANTVRATELCIRTIRAFAGYPHSLKVGDCGSTDGSLPMLRRLEAAGWLTLDVAPGGRHHAEWLDHWLATCTSDFAVFVDSDVEFRRAAWLGELISTALRGRAALVAAEMLPQFSNFSVPVASTVEAEKLFVEWFKGRSIVRLAPRPAPWLFLLDVRQASRLGTGFGFYSELADIPEEVLAFDVGGALFRQLERRGLPVAIMSPHFADAYHHYGGLSWVPLRGRRGLRKARDLCAVRYRLWWRRRMDSQGRIAANRL